MKRKMIKGISALCCFLCFDETISMQTRQESTKAGNPNSTKQGTIIPPRPSAPSTKPLPCPFNVSMQMPAFCYYLPLTFLIEMDKHKSLGYEIDDIAGGKTLFSKMYHNKFINLLEEDIFGRNIIYLLAERDNIEELLFVSRICIENESCVFRDNVHPKTLERLFNYNDKYGYTALSVVKSLEMYNCMVRNGANPKYVNSSNQTLLFSFTHKPDIFLTILNSDPKFFKLDQIDSKGKTPLDSIIEHHNYPLMYTLLMDYPHLFPHDEQIVLKLSWCVHDVFNPLRIEEGILLLEKLLQFKKISKAEICLYDKFGMTAIGYALAGGDDRFVEWLLAHGGHLSERDYRIFNVLKMKYPEFGVLIQNLINQYRDNASK